MTLWFTTTRSTKVVCHKPCATYIINKLVAPPKFPSQTSISRHIDVPPLTNEDILFENTCLVNGKPHGKRRLFSTRQQLMT